MNNNYKLLTTRRFLPLFLTQFLGAFNDNIFRNALVVLVTYRLADQVGISASILVTLALALFMLPYFLCSATAGQFADKYEPAKQVKRLKLCELGLMACTAFAFYLEHIWALMGLLSLMGMQSAFFGPLKYSMLPQQLQEDELIPGNALIEAGTFLAILLGTITGGIFVLGDHGTLTIAALLICFALTGLSTSLFIPSGKPMHPELTIDKNPFFATARIVKKAYHVPILFMAMLCISWFWMIGSVFLSVFPLYAKDVVGGDETVVTLFLTFFSIGVAIGSLLCQRLYKRYGPTQLVPYAAFGIGLLLLVLFFFPADLSPNEQMIHAFELLSTLKGIILLLILTLTSACMGLFVVPLNTMIQVRSDKATRARMIASNNIINAFFMVLTSGIIALVLGVGYEVTSLYLLFGLGTFPIVWLARRLLLLAEREN